MFQIISLIIIFFIIKYIIYKYNNNQENYLDLPGGSWQDTCKTSGSSFSWSKQGNLCMLNTKCKRPNGSWKTNNMVLTNCNLKFKNNNGTLEIE